VALHGAAPDVEQQAPALPLAPQAARPQAVAAVLPAAQASLHVPERRLPGRLPAATVIAVYGVGRSAAVGRWPTVPPHYSRGAHGCPSASTTAATGCP
jgi:hypothetical protein